MVLFQMLALYKWTLQLGGIQGGCLQAGPLDPKYRPLYARLPLGGIPGASEKQLVEVLGNVYGQNDAPSAWYRVFFKLDLFEANMTLVCISFGTSMACMESQVLMLIIL